MNQITNTVFGGKNLINNTINSPLQEKMSEANEGLPLEKKLFISHSSKDKELVDPFANMLINAGFPTDKLFYTANSSFGVSPGENINQRLRIELTKDTYVIFMLSRNWKNSETCENERGAVWHGGLDFCNILLPDFDYRDIGGVAYQTEMSIRYEDDEDELREKLGKLRRRLEKHFDLEFSDTAWEKSREKFLRLLLERK